GPLSVIALPSGTAQKIDDGAFDAAFGRRGQVLLYATGPTPSTDMNSLSVFGALHLWQPGMSAGARLTSGLAILSTSPPDVSVADGRTTMVGDTTSVLALAPMAFSPDGALFACATEDAIGPLQLLVVSTQAVSAVPWAGPPAGAGVIGLAFSDASTLLVHAA